MPSGAHRGLAAALGARVAAAIHATVWQWLAAAGCRSWRRYNGWATAPSGQQDKSVAGLAQLAKNMSTERTDPHPGHVGTAQGRARLRAESFRRDR